MQTIVYQCDTAMPAQKLPNCCKNKSSGFMALHGKSCDIWRLNTTHIARNV